MNTFSVQEEQNASSSANYDVELLHPSQAHDDLMKSGKSQTITLTQAHGDRMKSGKSLTYDVELSHPSQAYDR